MIELVLYQPEIPPNTGNILRLMHNSGCRLHLVEPLGFELDDKRLTRAGLDYIDWTRVTRHADWSAYLAQYPDVRRFAITTRGTRIYTEVNFQPGDHLIFGPETRGLPTQHLDQFAPENRLRIPMVSGSRSLNLSNAVALTLFEAWRQMGFEGGR